MYGTTNIKRRVITLINIKTASVHFCTIKFHNPFMTVYSVILFTYFMFGVVQ
jgi:hypothetical protein